MAPEGRVIVIGFAAGNIPSVKVNRLLLRNVAVIGAAYGTFLDLDHALMSRHHSQSHGTRGLCTPRT
ncbi:hypothetical protein R4P64_33280 [Rhodococcus sp. IEGM 1366]|uniref:hypothetical protein n=1 Tax=Rhodococcus sp. IEGM 1366 TaxID=3082223 RepID=UPI0029538647|nr:hypothetical protein [Rhodococcus sp. IEGM 1366]MDV8071387.1 hypothetical protein [Rhodococcus sp. IEGM 1366]